ncbi:MAG TPA: hypothetical protein VFF04_05540 [Candidatus Babeliales bacterium]|nr:hypothetical protein [Candidatus Babeliales bacterium]
MNKQILFFIFALLINTVQLNANKEDVLSRKKITHALDQYGIAGYVGVGFAAGMFLPPLVKNSPQLTFFGLGVLCVITMYNLDELKLHNYRWQAGLATIRALENAEEKSGLDAKTRLKMYEKSAGSFGVMGNMVQSAREFFQRR